MKFKKYVIKDLYFGDAQNISKPVKSWWTTKERDANITEMLERTRKYVLTNSTPRLDINKLEPQDAIDLMTKLLDIYK